MRRLVTDWVYRLVAIWSAALERNYHVYGRSLRARVSMPDIPVRPIEYYGQCGEDVIVAALLRAEAVNRAADLSQERYLEVGGNHPFATSPTFLLHRVLGLKGVIVEANPALLADLRKGRPADVVVHGAVQTGDVDTVTLTISNKSELSSLDDAWVRSWHEGSVGVRARVEVPALRMNDLVRTFLDGRAPCFLSTDVEALDLELLRDFDFEAYRPWLVQAEPSEQYRAGETQRMIEHMASVDYDLVARTDVNLIFRDART